MDTTKLSKGALIAAVSAFALLIFMFLPWYGVEAGGFGVSGGNASAWEAFSFVDILLFLAIVIVIGLVVAEAAGATPDLPQPASLIILVAGVVALLLVLFRLIFTPGVDTGGLDIDIDLSREIGVFLGLLAAAGMAYGGWKANTEDDGLGGSSTAGPTSRSRTGQAPPSAPAGGDPTPPSQAPGGGQPAPTPPSQTPPPPQQTPPAPPAAPPAGGQAPPAPPAGGQGSQDPGQPPAGGTGQV